MKTSGIDINKFIENHNHINYCEAIIYPNGTIEYAVPSHTYKLCDIYDNTKKPMEIELEIPMSHSPIDWLFAKCNCIGVWFDFFRLNARFQRMTEEQKDSLRALNNSEVTNIKNLEQAINDYDKVYEDFNNYLINNYSKERIKEIREKQSIY